MKCELQRLFGLPFEKINVIPNGININNFSGIEKDYEFTVEEGSTGEMFFLNNEVIYYEVNLIKVDSEDNSKLEGATYSLYNDKDELIGEYTTNSEGIALIKDLTIGKYYLVEKSAPVGHVLNTEKHEFTIDGNIK